MGLGRELWHACTGGTVQIPPVNSEVFYFPQGHAEHTLGYVDFGSLPKFPPSMILSRVEGVKYLADPETDEVYAKIRLVPIGTVRGFDEGGSVTEKPTSFAKTLTQSDANNGGGFSVPRYCAETIFPRLDYNSDPPVQSIVAKDVHGETWKFRHIFRGTPRRHLLTTGWSTFVNQKKLVAGDSIVFMRSQNGDISIGIRRSKKGNNSVGSPWNSANFSSFLEDTNRVSVKGESVLQATYLAANGQPFEVEFFPRVNTPEFCVRASSVVAALRVPWCPGIRFKMPFEAEDSSRISWSMGTVVSAVQAHDQQRLLWPNSPWRLLQVTWDEADLVHHVKCVNPWLVEMISDMPVPSFSSCLQPRKKLRAAAFQSDFYGPFPETPVFALQQNTVAPGIQGARHASNLLQMGLLPGNIIIRPDPPRPNAHDEEDVSCLLSIGSSCQVQEKTDDMNKTPRFVLFGQPILTEKQMSVSNGKSSSSEAIASSDSGENTRSSSGSEMITKPRVSSRCKVFIDSKDVNQSLDLSVIGSFQDLFKKLQGIVGLDVQGNVFYRDATGAVKPVGDEQQPFSNFAKMAERLIVHTKQNAEGRKTITGLATGARGLSSSNQAPSALSIFG